MLEAVRSIKPFSREEWLDTYLHRYRPAASAEEWPEVKQVLTTKLLNDMTTTLWALAWSDFVENLPDLDAEDPEGEWLKAEFPGPPADQEDQEYRLLRLEEVMTNARLYRELGGPGPAIMGADSVDIMPEPPWAARALACDLLNELTQLNQRAGVDLFRCVETMFRWHQELARERLGHCLVMEYLGHGVSWDDDCEDPHGIIVPDYSPSLLTSLTETEDGIRWIVELL